MQWLERTPHPVFIDNVGAVIVRHNHPLFKGIPPSNLMDSGNCITTFFVTNLQSIAAATQVKVFPRSISSVTSAPGIAASETHLLKRNQMAQTCIGKM
jgi:hypothetical protein